MSAPADILSNVLNEPSQDIAKGIKNYNLPWVLSLLCFSVAVLAWWLSLQQLSERKQSILHGLQREQANLATIIAENLSQVLDQEQAIALLAQGGFENRQQQLSNITSFLYGERAFNRIALFDLTGRQIYQSSPRSSTDIQQTSMRQLLDEMVVSNRPLTVCNELKNREAPWQIPLLFPLFIGRELHGAINLELDLGYILNLYQDIDFGRTGKISIRTDTGQVLAQAESGGLAVNNKQHKVAAVNSYVGQHGTRIYHSFSGNGPSHMTFRRLEHYPFIITVSQDLDEVFATFNERKRQQLILLTLITAGGLVGFFSLLQMIKRKQEYLQALAASDAVNNELIEKLEREHQNAVDAASFDPLTNLYNRRLFVSLAQKNLLLAKRNKFSYAVLFIDLDRFKTINDTLGHRVGDLLLKAVADRLVGCVRESDIVSRFGGDEFVVMLTEMAPDTDIVAIAEKIIKAISAPCDNLDGHQINTSPSIGIAIYPRDGEDIEALMRNADAAMYKSKRAGRGRYSFFDSSLNTVSIQQFEMEQRMPTAIANNEFVLHYQPKVRLEDYRVVGLEALVRWQHPDHNLIYPGDFIESAEATGLINDLGNWVLEAACRQLANWRQAGIHTVPLAVNVSPIQLRDANLAANFFATLERYGLKTADIEVEVTESAFIEDKATVTDNLNALFDGGVCITLDDFGNGFSSLSHIRSLPIRSLKIDRSFIRDIRGSHHDNVIVSSTIALAQKLDLSVVAEGVESYDQLMHLRMAGCEQVQGYFFSRPVPEQEIREFLTSPIRTPAS